MSEVDRVIDQLSDLTRELRDVVVELKGVATQQAGHADEIGRLRASLEEERKERIQLDKKVDKWVQRGWGAWGAVVAIFTVVTALNWPQQLMATPPDVAKRPTSTQTTTGRL